MADSASVADPVVAGRPDGGLLHERLLASERLFAQTGSYHGLTGTLELKERSPILYEKIFSRLRGGLVTARETAVNISASPIVKELGELCFALYTPEGDSVALSTGIIVHVHTMSDAIKYMIRQGYETNPGIEPGDIFCNNDAMVGDVHNADVQTIVPIFWEGELIGWAGGVTHELDIGARTPGGVPLGPISRFEDGIDIPARKIGAGDELFRDHVLAGMKGTRTPRYWMLDERTRLAGCHMVRDTVLRVVADIGLDVYRDFMREVIEDGRRSFKARVREMLIPGTYRAPAFSEFTLAEEQMLPEHARRDSMMHAPVEMRVTRDATLELDYEGASSWGYHSANCTPSAMQGALWVLLTQTLICNDKINDGAYFGLRTNFPPGSWANHQNPQASTGLAWHYLIPSYTGVLKSISRGLQARGFVEEVLAPYAMSSNTFQGGGIDHYGEQSSTTNFAVSCVGVGARIYADGLDHAAALWNPQGDMGDYEMWEIVEPFLYLGARVKPNTAGAGRRRGGSGWEAVRFAWKTPFFETQNLGNGPVFIQAGLWGGYPGATGYRHNVRDTNMKELFGERLAYPVFDGDPESSEMERLVTGRRDFDQRTLTLPETMKEGDLYLSVYRGAAGLGDPLERELADVQADIDGNYLLPRLASSVYGAVVRDGVVDVEASLALRERMRRERAEKSVPVAEWMEAERRRILAHLEPPPGDAGAARDGDSFIPVVQQMYAESLRLSPRWAAFFRDFWDLPADFDFPVATPTVEISRRLLGEGLGATTLHPDDPARSQGISIGRPVAAESDVTEEVLEELIDGQLPEPRVRAIQSGYKDADRFQKYVRVLQRRVPWPDRILLPFGEHLHIVQTGDGRRIVKCDCGHEFRDYRENWKLDAHVNVRRTEPELREIYPAKMHGDPRWNELRELFCPGCWTLLEVEAVPPGYPLVHDFTPDLEGFYEEWLGEPLAPVA
ncbi:MAG: hydantoinase B/oxoprolinase family protein [Solirubrobacteraceae bacterium]|nr:hydantoinase B/oxoprolinase family protein [Solirubrobacteraceae bacterium]